MPELLSKCNPDQKASKWELYSFFLKWKINLDSRFRDTMKLLTRGDGARNFHTNCHTRTHNVKSESPWRTFILEWEQLIYSWFKKGFFDHWKMLTAKLLFGGHSSKSLQWVPYAQMPNAQCPKQSLLNQLEMVEANIVQWRQNRQTNLVSASHFCRQPMRLHSVRNCDHSIHCADNSRWSFHFPHNVRYQAKYDHSPHQI